MKQKFSANLAIHSSFVQQLANRDLTTKLMVASGFSYYDGFYIFLKLLKDTAFVEVSLHNSHHAVKLWHTIFLSDWSKSQGKQCSYLFLIHAY